MLIKGNLFNIWFPLYVDMDAIYFYVVPHEGKNTF